MEMSASMWSFVIRRVLQMIPTIFGVIIVTFILFNVAGGDIGSAVLGKHVSPAALEDFDTQRGYDKPLLFGFWGTSRAHPDSSFEKNLGVWTPVEGVQYDDRGWLVLQPGLYNVPLGFSLKGPDVFRFNMKARGKGVVSLVVNEGEGLAVPVSPRWKTLRTRFDLQSGAHTLAVKVEGDPIEVKAIALRRQNANPFNSQFLFYLKQIAKLDFGVSYQTNQRVSKMVLDGIWPSVRLTFPMLVVGLITSISLSLLCAFFRDSLLDRSLVVIAVALMSINYLVWIVVGQYIFGYRWGWFPVWGYESWIYIALPVLIGVISGLGSELRLYRTVMLDEMYKDYVRTAFAKGVSKPTVLFKHVLKNALIPIITNLVLAIAFLYTGSLLLESFFGIPGLGYISINAINSSDVDVLRAVVFIGSVIFVVANLLTDLCYAWVDPRVKLQ